MSSPHGAGYSVRNAGAHWVIAYAAMASPCEVLVRGGDDTAPRIEKLASLAYEETLRIENKFSRYRSDNIVHEINQSDGAPVVVDDETSRLLQYAGQCYDLSGGRFDITSGVLRGAWTFNGGAVAPDRMLIESLLERVGWPRLEFDGSSIRLPRGMEIDLGGIGKEYAADRIAQLMSEAAGASVLVNLGGDIRAIAPGDDLRRWTIGIERPARDEGPGDRDEKPALDEEPGDRDEKPALDEEPGDRDEGSRGRERRPNGRKENRDSSRAAVGQIDIAEGGVATSGDAHRFCIVDGVRLGHILDPRTGWPVADAPRSVSVVADTCTAAGFLATLAILHGPDAESFLQAQGVTHHCMR